MSSKKKALILYNNEYFNHILYSTLSKHPKIRSDYNDLLEEITNGKVKINQNAINLFSKLTEVNPHFMFKRYSGSGNITALFDTLKKNKICGYFMSLEDFLKDSKEDIPLASIKPFPSIVSLYPSVKKKYPSFLRVL